MCTRLFNNLNPLIPMTGRNFDWHYPLNTFLYRLPASEEVRSGVEKNALKNHEPMVWRSYYNSICTYLGSKELGYASIDGINEKGLVVNGLEDLLAHFQDAQMLLSEEGSLPLKVLNMIEEDRKAFTDKISIPTGTKLLCSLRWVQFVLDQFDSVRVAADYFRRNPDNIFVYSGEVPDGREEVAKAKLHLTLSDKSGNSAIIELRGDGFIVNESPDYTVATVTPRFEVQQLLLKPWLKKWQDPNQAFGLTLFDVPGGTATHQRFARASYFYHFSQPCWNEQSVLAQTRSLMATCATPLELHLEAKPGPESTPSATTRWSSISEHLRLRYHHFNSSSLLHQWADFSDFDKHCERVLLVKSVETDEEESSDFGNVTQSMRKCPIPFRQE